MPDKPAYEIPASQKARLFDIREAMLRDIKRGVGALDGPLRARTATLVDDIMATLSMSRAKRDRVVKRLLKAYHREGYGALGAQVADMVQDADSYIARYQEILTAYRVRMRHKLVDKPGPGQVEAISKFETWFLTNYARGSRAALSYLQADATRAQADGEAGRLINAAKRKPPKVPQALTQGDRLAREHLTPWRGVKGLSPRLHGHAIADGDEASRIVIRSIRESESISKSAREMQRLLKAKGHKLAGSDKLPRVLDDLKAAGKNLSRRAGPDELMAWDKAMAQVDKYQRTLAKGGTVQNGYVELLQRLKDPKWGHKRLETIVNDWNYRKQRFRAEAIIRTEVPTSYRIQQTSQDKAKPWVVGYIWRLNRGTHRSFAKRYDKTHKKGKKGLGGARCECEVMNGERISPATAREYVNGAHPHCNCTFEPIFDNNRLISTPITAAEEAWLND